VSHDTVGDGRNTATLTQGRIDMKATLKGNMLVIEIALDKGKPSSTGKSIIRFSSRGFQHVSDGLRANVTVIAPVK
jgi:hypothetical protein